MFAAVFSCTMTSTVAGNSTFPLTWSPWVWVLIMVVIGLVVRFRMASSTGRPQSGSFVSTTTTPIYGRLSDLYGRRPVLLVAISLFVGASVLCALALSVPPLRFLFVR